MAPSNKLTLIALLVVVAFAVFAPSAAAIRDGGAAKDAPAPAPSVSGEDAVHPMSIPFVPCYNETKPVAECRSLLTKYMPPCAGFLTDADNGSLSAPPKECCNAIRPFFNDHSEGGAPLCLCHVVNGDFGKLLKAPMNHTRADSFLPQCGLDLSSAQIHRICTDTTFHIPPMDAPSPPPTWRHH